MKAAPVNSLPIGRAGSGVDIPGETPAGWLFPEEKATLNALIEATVTLILL